MTIHSPIILDCLNNMLMKGMLLEKYKERKAEINKLSKIPVLYPNEVSSNFINRSGRMKNLLALGENQLKVKKIAEIIDEIKEVASELSKFDKKNDY